jgi:four helix bundle protein
MAYATFANLKVYRLCETLADEVWKLVLPWDGFARDTVGKQIVRSADSIGANIAEGAGRRSFKENQRFVKIARGSLNETRHWLRRAYRRGLLSEKQVMTLRPLIDELAPTLNAYLRSIGPVTGPPAEETGLAGAEVQGQRTKDKGRRTTDA